jgi:hypothetical protein
MTCARRGLDHDQLLLRNLARGPQENAAGLIHAGNLRMRLGEPPKIGGQRFFIALHLFADEHQIDLQSAQMPKRVRN